MAYRIPLSPATRSLRGQLAAASRADATGDVAILKREHDVSRLADHIRAVVDTAPPLSTAQKSRLVTLIRGA